METEMGVQQSRLVKTLTEPLTLMAHVVQIVIQVMSYHPPQENVLSPQVMGTKKRKKPIMECGALAFL